MIDNVRFQIIEKDKFENLIISNKLIDLTSTINHFTGEIALYPKKGKYFNLDISVTLNNTFVGGSLHKFNNMLLYNENQNHNDFNFCQIIESIEYLTNKFACQQLCNIQENVRKSDRGW